MPGQPSNKIQNPATLNFVPVHLPINSNGLQEINILIVDDYQLVREGIRTMLSLPNDWFSFKIFEADNGREACALVRSRKIDLVLMDYNLPEMSGPEAIYEILIYKPETLVLAMSQFDEMFMVNQMLDAGAKGYLLKNMSQFELLAAIQAILAGARYQSSALLVKQNVALRSGHRNFGGANLTAREYEIWLLIAREMTNKEIAANLHIDKRTVDNHRHNLMRKLKVKNSIGLVRLAYKYNLCK